MATNIHAVSFETMIYETAGVSYPFGNRSALESKEGEDVVQYLFLEHKIIFPFCNVDNSFVANSFLIPREGPPRLTEIRYL